MNGAIFNDWNDAYLDFKGMPLFYVDYSDTVKDTDIVAVDLTHYVLHHVISSDLECLSKIFNDGASYSC